MSKALALVAILVLGLATGCGDDDDEAGGEDEEESDEDGFRSVGTGDTYGEWELFAEYEDGDWTGCLRIDLGQPVEEDCADPQSDELEVFRGSGGDVLFGGVPEGADLQFDDGDEVPLIEDRFFVVAGQAEISLAE